MGAIFTLFCTQRAPLQRMPQFSALLQRDDLVRYWRESAGQIYAHEQVCDRFEAA